MQKEFIKVTIIIANYLIHDDTTKAGFPAFTSVLNASSKTVPSVKR